MTRQINICVFRMVKHLLNELNVAAVRQGEATEGCSAGVTHLGVFDHAYSMAVFSSKVKGSGVRFPELTAP